MASQLPIPENLDDLVALLQEESAKRRQSDRILKQAVGALVGIFMLAIVVLWIRRGSYPDDLASSFASFAGLGGIGAAASNRHKQALAMAAKFDDPRLLPFLIEATTLPQPSAPALAREVLLSRLPTLTEPDDLPVEARRQLAASLLNTTELRYLRVALDALQQVAGGESIHSLEAFTKRPIRKNAKEIAKLKERTRLVLGDARMRAAREVIQAKEFETSEILGQFLTANPLPVTEGSPVKSNTTA